MKKLICISIFLLCCSACTPIGSTGKTCPYAEAKKASCDKAGGECMDCAKHGHDKMGCHDKAHDKDCACPTCAKAPEHKGCSK